MCAPPSEGDMFVYDDRPIILSHVDELLSYIPTGYPGLIGQLAFPLSLLLYHNFTLRQYPTSNDRNPPTQ